MKTINPRNKHLTRNRKSKINFSKLIFYFILVVFFGTIIYLIFFSPFLQITNIQADGLIRTHRSDFFGEINAQLDGKTLNFIKKNNFLLIDSLEIEKNVLSEFRQIGRVDVRKKFPSKLEVKISERISSLIACNDSCYLLDENGEAYDDRDLAMGEARTNGVLEVVDLSRKKIELNSHVLEKDYIEYLLTLRKKINEDVLLVENAVETPSFISRDVRMKTKEGWKIFFNENIGVEKELEMLRVVLKNQITEKQRNDLEYIDLRIDNKVYYKFRDGTDSEKARLESLEISQKTSNENDEKKKDKKKD